MEDYYDFSRHKYCINFEFNNINLLANCFDNIAHNQDWGYIRKESFGMPSILYNTETGITVARGEVALKKWLFQNYQKGFCYVRNIFTKLHDVYSRMEKNPGEANLYDSIITQETVRFLRNEVIGWEKRLELPKSDFHYAFTLPTDWNYNIRNKFIRPLFIQAGIINKEDHDDRLLFFSKLESLFRYIQTPGEKSSFQNFKVDLGKQYAICTLDFDGEVCVDLELFSTHYPNLKSKDTKYVPRSLKSMNFRFPFRLKEKIALVKACLEKQCNTTLIPEFIEMIAPKIKYPRHIPKTYGRYDLSDFRFEEDQSGTFFDFTPFQKFFNYQPFKGLKDLRRKEFNLKQKEIENIELVTINDIFTDFPDYVKKTILYQICLFFQGTKGEKTTEFAILFTEEYAQDDEKLVLLKLIEKWLNEYNEKYKVYELITNGDKSVGAMSFILAPGKIMYGGEMLVKKKIIESIAFRDPKILSRNTKVESVRPVYYINIDMLPTDIIIQTTHMRESNQNNNTATRYKCLYKRSVLRISSRMKQCIETIFGKRFDLIRPGLKRKASDRFVQIKAEVIKKRLSKVDMEEMFSKNSKAFADDDAYLVIADHPSHLIFFTIMYLFYLKKLIKEKLNKDFENYQRNTNTAYALSVDKRLLENVFGSKEALKELLFASGILSIDNYHCQVQITTYGEDILPAIQQKVDVDFKMKSYFVVAQLHSNHIQLTLHQVVKLANTEDNAATIIIEDKVIPIDDVYDALCENVWMNLILSRSLDNYCLNHSNEKSDPHSLNSLKGYKNTYQKLKLWLDDILRLQLATVDMNSEYNFRINNECTCKIDLVLRDIIEIGIKPVIQNITTIIAASMTNKTLFGNYGVDFLFLLGNPYRLSAFSPIYTIYTNIVQEEIRINIEIKEKDIQAFSFQESFHQLLQPVIREKPYMYDRFIKGVLSQKSLETYGVRFRVPGYRDYVPFFCMDNNNKDNNAVIEDGDFLVILQKGQSISIAGSAIKRKFCFGEYTSDADSNEIIVEFIKVQHLNNKVPEIWTVLKDDSEGPKCERSVYKNTKDTAFSPIIIDIESINHDCTLKLSVRIMGFNANDADGYTVLRQPLTLTYV